jgi:hypothetical protein
MVIDKHDIKKNNIFFNLLDISEAIKNNKIEIAFFYLNIIKKREFNDFNTCFEIGKMFALLQYYSEAELMYRRALRINSSFHDELYLSMGICLFEQSKTIDAFMYIHKSYLFTQTPVKSYYMARCYIADGNLKMASHILNEARSFGEDKYPLLLLELAHGYFREKDIATTKNIINDINQIDGNKTTNDKNFKQVVTCLNRKITQEYSESTIQKFTNIASCHSAECYIFVLCYGALGDMYISLSVLTKFIEEKRENNKNATLKIITVPKFQAIVEFFFERDVYKVVRKISEAERLDIYSHFEGLVPNIPIVLFPRYMSFFKDGRKRSVINVKNFMTMFPVFLDFPNDTPLVKPKISDEKRIKALNFLDEIGFSSQKFIIIATHANTIVPEAISIKKYWQPIVDNCVAKGYKVIQNVGLEIPIKLDNVTPINIPLDIVIPVFNICGRSIMLRSGLCDLVLETECLKFVLTPSDIKQHTNYKLSDMTDNGMIYDYHLQTGYEDMAVKDTLEYLKLDEWKIKI